MCSAICRSGNSPGLTVRPESLLSDRAHWGPGPWASRAAALCPAAFPGRSSVLPVGSGSAPRELTAPAGLHAASGLHVHLFSPCSGPRGELSQTRSLPLGSQSLPWGPLLGRIPYPFVRHSWVSPLPPPRGGEPGAAGGGGRGWTFGLFRLFPPSLWPQLPRACLTPHSSELPGSRGRSGAGPPKPGSDLRPRRRRRRQRLQLDSGPPLPFQPASPPSSERQPASLGP